MGYREIALVADVPIGTVMSRLARGRRKLAALLGESQGGLPGASGGTSQGRPPKALPDAGSGAGAASGAACQGRYGTSGRAAGDGSSDGLGNSFGASGRQSGAQSKNQGSTARGAFSGMPSASVTPLRAVAAGKARSSIHTSGGGSAAGFARETPDGL